MFNAHGHRLNAMRRSPLKHTLAILRQITGCQQKQFAELVGKSTRTIQAIELGQLRLSEKLAERISFETGIYLPWLLEDDVTCPPFSRNMQRYTREYFERYRAVVEDNGGFDNTENAEIQIRFLLSSELAEIMATAIASKKSGSMALFSYKTSRALRQLAKEFGAEEAGRFSEEAAPYWDPKQRFEIGVGKMLEKFFAEWKKTAAPVKGGKGRKAGP
jgi:transcriptional regulator with XRE-family HTH domain